MLNLYTEDVLDYYDKIKDVPEVEILQEPVKLSEFNPNDTQRIVFTFTDPEGNTQHAPDHGTVVVCYNPFMTTPLLIVVTGFPCTGKTTLAEKIASHFSFPLISRDDISEILFDYLDWQSQPWDEYNKTATPLAYRLLWHFVENELKANNSLVIESNFQPQYTNSVLDQLKQAYRISICQIYCQTEVQILWERIQDRIASGKRHPAHGDHQFDYQSFKELYDSGRYNQLQTGGEIVTLDTTHFSNINHTLLFEMIDKLTHST